MGLSSTGQRRRPPRNAHKEITGFPRHSGKDVPAGMVAVVRSLDAWRAPVANDLNYGEQPRNRWQADKRPKRMVRLIEEKLGQISETKDIERLLQDALEPSNQRNHLAHGIWWAFDTRTSTIRVRGGTQREGEDQFADYTEERIQAIADEFETLEAELYKLRSAIETRRGDARLDI